MTKLRSLFATITKVDAESGLVYGRLTQEVQDKSGETLDYELSKPYFEAWSNEAAKATGGKSLGNVRAMHQLKAVGKLTEIDFVDADKAVDICAKVVDQDELNLCAEGVYTGFSVGGKLVKRWKDGDTQKIIIAPSECSLVDNPCVPTAHFTYMKAAGAEAEEKAFKLWEPTAGDLAARAEEIAKAEGNGIVWSDRIEEAREALIAEKAASAIGDGIEDGEEAPPASPRDIVKAVVADMLDDAIDDLLMELGDSPDEAAIKAWAPWDLVAKADAKEDDKPKGDYGDVEYADPGMQKDKKPRYPIDTAAHIRAAWSYINKEKNAEAYSSADLAKIKAKIIAAWKDKIDKDGPPSASSDKSAPVEDKTPEWEQVWRTRDGSTFAKKADAIARAGAIRAGAVPLAQALKAAKGDESADLVPWPHVPALGRAIANLKAVREAFEDNVVVKGLYGVSRLAELIESLGWLTTACGYETEAEGDNSPLPAALATNLKGLCETLCMMAEEETSELIASLAGQGIAVEVMPAGDDAVVVEMSADAPVIKASEAVYKAGARNSKSDMERLQAAHDAIAQCGAECLPDNLPEVEKEKLAKIDGGADEFAVLKAENVELRKLTDDALAEFKSVTDSLRAEIETLKAQPAPDLRLVSKEGDIEGGGSQKSVSEQVIDALKTMTPDQIADMAIRATQQRPRAMVSTPEAA